MIITTINDAQQQQNSATQHPDGGEEEPGSYVISELGCKACGRNVCVWSSSQPNRAALRSDSTKQEKKPSEEEKIQPTRRTETARSFNRNDLGEHTQHYV